jgi:hypothetical protein
MMKLVLFEDRGLYSYPVGWNGEVRRKLVLPKHNGIFIKTLCVTPNEISQKKKEPYMLAKHC